MRSIGIFILFLVVSKQSFASDTLKCPGGYFDSTLNMQVYEYPDVDPSFPGDDESMIAFIRGNLVMPEFDEEEEIVSVAYVGFTVLPSGKLVNIRIINQQSVELNRLEKEAIRLVTLMPDWLPGTCNGVPVAVEFSLPLRICLK